MRNALAYALRYLWLTLYARLLWLAWFYEDYCYRETSRHADCPAARALARECSACADDMCSRLFETRSKRQALGALHVANKRALTAGRSAGLLRVR